MTGIYATASAAQLHTSTPCAAAGGENQLTIEGRVTAPGEVMCTWMRMQKWIL